MDFVLIFEIEKYAETRADKFIFPFKVTKCNFALQGRQLMERSYFCGISCKIPC